MTASLITSLFGLFALFEMPIFVVIVGLTLALVYLVDRDLESLQVVLIEMDRLASMPVLVALPIFTFVGLMLTESKAPQRMMKLGEALFGWLPGGIAIAALVSSAFFTALTGASGVTIVAIGSIIYPILREKGYEEKFCLGLVTTGGSLGLLFPPSLPVILYGVISEIDIGEIYKAAFVPGILLIGILSLYAIFYHLTNAERLSLSRQQWNLKLTLREMIAARYEVPVVIIVIVGIYGGFVTISEVSVIVCAYVFIVETMILKEIRGWQKLRAIAVESAVLSGAIIVILGVALAFTGHLVDVEIPMQVMNKMVEIATTPIVFLLMLNVFLIVVGCIMDIFSAIIIVVPIMLPVAQHFGINPFHLGVVFLVNLEIGYCTPPVGINLFIASLRFDKPITLLYRAAVPFLLLLLAALSLVTYWPPLSLIFR